MLHRCGTLPTLYCPLFMTFVPRQLNGRASDPCVKPWGCDRNKSPKLPSFQLLNRRAMTTPVFSLTMLLKFTIFDNKIDGFIAFYT